MQPKTYQLRVRFESTGEWVLRGEFVAENLGDAWRAAQVVDPQLMVVYRPRHSKSRVLMRAGSRTVERRACMKESRQKSFDFEKLSN